MIDSPKSVSTIPQNINASLFEGIVTTINTFSKAIDGLQHKFYFNVIETGGHVFWTIALLGIIWGGEAKSLESLTSEEYLGKQLFYDRRLSKEDQLACVDCHSPKFGWSDGQKLALGFNNTPLKRHSPSLINVGLANELGFAFFWDLRANNLETQALMPIQNPDEMNMPIDALIAKLSKIQGYQDQFVLVYGRNIDPDLIAKALVAFEKTISIGSTPYSRWLKESPYSGKDLNGADRFLIGGELPGFAPPTDPSTSDTSILNESQQRGYKLFARNCMTCHAGENLSNGGAFDIGLPGDDIGFGRYSNAKKMQYAFKTPSLWGIAQTAPYMHNGSLETLLDVVKHYNRGGSTNTRRPSQTPLIRPLNLEENEITDLVNFLHALSPDTPFDQDPPELPQ